VPRASVDRQGRSRELAYIGSEVRGSRRAGLLARFLPKSLTVSRIPIDSISVLIIVDL